MMNNQKITRKFPKVWIDIEQFNINFPPLASVLPHFWAFRRSLAPSSGSCRISSRSEAAVYEFEYTYRAFSPGFFWCLVWQDFSPNRFPKPVRSPYAATFLPAGCRRSLIRRWLWTTGIPAGIFNAVGMEYFTNKGTNYKLTPAWQGKICDSSGIVDCWRYLYYKCVMPPASGGCKPINQEQAGTYQNMVKAHKPGGSDPLQSSIRPGFKL